MRIQEDFRVMSGDMSDGIMEYTIGLWSLDHYNKLISFLDFVDPLLFFFFLLFSSFFFFFGVGLCFF
jgi:hypothetical protein